MSDDGFLIGIVSSGIGECASGGLDLNTNVYKFLDFINEAMGVNVIERIPMFFFSL